MSLLCAFIDTGNPFGVDATRWRIADNSIAHSRILELKIRM